MIPILQTEKGRHGLTPSYPSLGARRQLGLPGKMALRDVYHPGHKLLVLFGGHDFGGRMRTQLHDCGISHLGKQLRPKN